MLLMIKLLQQLFLLHHHVEGNLFTLTKQIFTFFSIVTVSFNSFMEKWTSIFIVVPFVAIYKQISFKKFWNFKILNFLYPIEWVNVPIPPFLVG